MWTRISITLLGLLAALALVAVPAATAATNVHRATLHGSPAYPGVTGSAKFQRDNGVRELEAEIQHAKVLAGTKVRFRVNGNVVGTATVNSLGRAQITQAGRHRSRRLHRLEDQRPEANGALVASGTFS